MPYLSRIQLNPLRSGAQRLLNNPQAIHAAVLGSRPPGVEGRVLWRDEVTRTPSGALACELLVLSYAEPDWSHLIEQAGWQTADGRPLVRDIQPLLDLAITGRQFAFKVRANPVSATKSPEHPTAGQRRAMEAERPRGVRVAHRTAGHQTRWFLERTQESRAPWGFSVDQRDGQASASLVARDHQVFVKGNERRKVTLDRATFEGVLTVTDSARFRDVLVSGMGKGKAYGCGLLTLAPVTGHVVAG